MKKLTNKEFINKAIEIHGDKYSYNECEYLNSNSKVTINCSIHGNFEQRASAHIGNQKQGCPKCNINTRQTGLSEFLIRAIEIHGDKYDYSLVTEYKPNREHVEVICKNHGSFNISINHHINRYQGCPKCKSLDDSDFIAKSNFVHLNKYDYTQVNYVNNKTKVNIICPTHGLFSQRPSDHMSGNGCPTCNESKGEREIRKCLVDNNINFISQHTFNDCVGKDKKLPFDFYLPEYNTCLEFNGIQHYELVKHFGGEKKLIRQQKTDKIKKEYCLKNNIPLIIIKYNEKIKETLLIRITMIT
jgi:hypothetical protein